MFNWNYLETFIVLSENLSFSETARILKTAQPAISRQIRLLEENLGYPLFIRSRKSVVLSKEGQQLRVQLAPLVEEIKKVMLTKQEVGSLLSGTIRVGSMQEAGQLLLMPTIRQFLKIHPDMDIHTTFMSSSQVSDEVLKGSIDFGFVYRLSGSKTLRAYALTEDKPVLIQSAKSKLSLADRKTLDFVCYREDDSYTKGFLEKHLSRSELKKVRYRSSVNSHPAMVQMVIEDDMLAVIPMNSAQATVTKNQTKIVMEDTKQHALHLICHEQTLIDKRKKLFCDFLLKEFRKK